MPRCDRRSRRAPPAPSPSPRTERRSAGLSPPLSKRLSDRKEVLKVADPLLLALARWAGLHARIQQVLISAFETEILRPVDAVPQIHAQRPHRRLVAYAEAHRVHHVVEVALSALVLAQREVAEAGVDVAHIVEEHAADIVADQGEAKLGLIEQQGRASPIRGKRSSV